MNGLFKRLTAGKIACLGVILFIIGNEIYPAEIRQILEILAGVIAAVGLLFE